VKATLLLAAISIAVTLAVLFSFAPLIGVDDAVATALHSYALDHSGVVAAMQTWTNVFGPWTFRGLLTVVAAWLLWRRRRLLAGWVFATMLVAAGLDSGLKTVIGRVRPHWTQPVSQAVGGSFPSGHALTSAMGCAVLLALVWPIVGRGARRACVIAAVTVPAVTGFTRLGLGVHYLSDVVGGWLIAVTLVAATILALHRFTKNGAIQGDDAVPGGPAKSRWKHL
jgi:membrane-associated phospholipid phosphatase